jgi:hypothetical protein
MSPSSISLTPGTPLTITFSAASGTPAASSTATVTGTSSGISHNASLSLAVFGGNIGTPSTRTKYVRTDSSTEYFLSVNSHWVVYDAPTSRFFSTDPYANQVFAFDSRTETQIASIGVPGAYSIDESPDQSSLFVGTLLGDVYVLDPVNLKVKRRYVASEIGPYGFQALVALGLADGRIALLGAAGGIPSVDGSSAVAIWKPSDNSIAIYGAPATPGTPSSPLCNVSGGLHIFGFALSVDRTLLYTGGGQSLCRLDTKTGQFASVTPAGRASPIVLSPDGRYIALGVVPSSVELIDTQTLAQVVQFPVSGDISNLFFSPDSKTLFVNGAGTVFAYGVSSHTQTGWLPNIFVTNTSGGFVESPVDSPYMGAADTTGIIAGPLEQGFGFLDTTQLRTGPVGTAFTNAYLDPPTGPVAGGTVTQWPAFPAVNAQSQIFFGSVPATSFSESGNFISATTPGEFPGPADIYLFTTDGGMQLIPEGFSYGPTILQVTTNLATAEGGQGALYGYGFGPGSNGAPANLTVSVGGQTAAILGVNPNAYNVSGQPFQLEAIYFTIPPGTAGDAADVTVTTPSGTATAKAGLTYLPGLTQFALPGSSLVQGVYDPIRDIYYFTDANKIQVFSRTQGKWLTPIPVTPPPGQTPRLWGIALSPNSTKLAVADAGSKVVYLIDPANPASIKTFPVAPSVPTGVLVLPAGVAVTDGGAVYLTVDVQGGTGYHNFFLLHTINGALSDLGIDGPGLGANDSYLKTAVSADNTRAYFNSDGYIFSVDTSTGKIFNASISQGCCYGDYDLNLSPNQTQFQASSYLYDSDLNGLSFLSANHRESEQIQFVYGTKLSPDGGLLFQPLVQGIAIFDGKIGQLRSQVALPVALSTNYDALVSNGKDNVLIAITGTNGSGIAVVDLTSLPEPGTLPFAAHSTVASATGEPQKHQKQPVLSTGQSAQKSSARIPPHSIPHITNPSIFPRQ